MDIFLRSKEGKKEYFPKENSIYLERESLWRTKLPQVCYFYDASSSTVETYQAPFSGEGRLQGRAKEQSRVILSGEENEETTWKQYDIPVKYEKTPNPVDRTQMLTMRTFCGSALRHPTL